MIYGYVLHVTNSVAMATMYVVNFVNKLQKSEKKKRFLSHFYNIDHR